MGSTFPLLPFVGNVGDPWDDFSILKSEEPDESDEALLGSISGRSCLVNLPRPNVPLPQKQMFNRDLRANNGFHKPFMRRSLVSKYRGIKKSILPYESELAMVTRYDTNLNCIQNLETTSSPLSTSIR